MASILVLAECEDLLALRVIRMLRHRGASVVVLTPAQLALACTWVHRLDGTAVCTDIWLDGRMVVAPAAVLNRLSGVRFFPAPLWRTVEDASYAEVELGALIVSWLASVGGIALGPPSTGILHHHPGMLEWTSLAREAGLPVRGLTWTTDASCVVSPGAVLLDPFDPERLLTAIETQFVGHRPVIVAEPLRESECAFVVGDRTIGVPDASLAPGLARLSALSGWNLLECRFGRTDEADRQWVFSGACARFSNAPASVISAIADTLMQARAAAA
jgi:hypothetical protein